MDVIINIFNSAIILREIEKGRKKKRKTIRGKKGRNRVFKYNIYLNILHTFSMEIAEKKSLILTH